jgi:3D (Asp-Asp-Asp) domain-containing protein
MFITLFTIVINVYYKGQISEAEKEIEILKESKKIKEDKISELELEIESVYEKLSEKENSILEFEEKLKKVENENEKLKKELEKYDSLRKLNMVATAYTSKCDGCTGITATGYDVRNTVYKDGYRVVSTDKNVIPMDSLLYIESVNDSFEPFVAISSDVGGAIKGNRIDILVENESKAYGFGVRDIKVTVLREGGG